LTLIQRKIRTKASLAVCFACKIVDSITIGLFSHRESLGLEM
jgi:hypothetical protein